MLYSQNRHDISDLVLRGIARTRKISKSNKKDNQESRLKEFESEQTAEEMSDALKDRKDKAKQAEDVRIKTAEEKRAEQLKLREDRKKAYEERRTKLLEEREAKRKAKLEDRQKGTEQKKDTIN